jgi:hypothetical protein
MRERGGIPCVRGFVLRPLRGVALSLLCHLQISQLFARFSVLSESGILLARVDFRPST